MKKHVLQFHPPFFPVRIPHATRFFSRSFLRFFSGQVRGVRGVRGAKHGDAQVVQLHEMFRQHVTTQWGEQMDGWMDG